MNIYIHVPFCERKCDYCAFYSESVPADSPQINAWLDKLERDVMNSSAAGKEVDTLYLGGGTPTFLSPAHLKRLYTFLRGTFVFKPESEITTECNPGSLTHEKAEQAAGFINRVSMGAQSFSQETLNRLGRRTSTPEAVRKTAELLRKNGIFNIGLDLICAAPGQTLESFKHDLESALELAPKHLSVYSLILEENTPLARMITEKDLPDDDLSTDMWLQTGEILAKAGMPRYEVSNYAAKPYRCRHNWNVWHGEPYYAFGPSACSFDGFLRKTEKASLKEWLSGMPAEEDPLPREKRLREIFIMGLRSVDGWPLHGAYDWTFLLPELKQLAEEKYLFLDEGNVRPTEHGLLFWNDLAEALIR